MTGHGLLKEAKAMLIRVGCQLYVPIQKSYRKSISGLEFGSEPSSLLIHY
jgi:hypothetical protein